MNRLLVSLSIVLALTAIPDTAQAAPHRGASHATHGRASNGGARASAAKKSTGKKTAGKKTAGKKTAGKKSTAKTSSAKSAPSTERRSPRADTARDTRNGPVEHADAGRAEANRADAGRADAGRGESTRAAAHGTPAGARTVELGGPRATVARPAAAHGVARAASNYRSVSRTERARTSHAEATARTHRDAARAAYVHHSVARHAARHAAATRWHRAYAHRHYAWYQPRGWFVRWAPGRPHHWYHGVFVYGPPPWAPPPPPGHPRAHVPERAVDHAGDFSIGLRGATYTSAYDHGYAFSDAGLGVAARYRIADPLGVEVQWTYHDSSWNFATERIEQPLSASVELFALPWARVNPFLIGGLTLTSRNIQDKVGPSYVDETRAGFGPHVGVGLDFNLSQRTSLTLDARYLSYVNLPPTDATQPGAVQGNLGLNVSF